MITQNDFYDMQAKLHATEHQMDTIRRILWGVIKTVGGRVQLSDDAMASMNLDNIVVAMEIDENGNQAYVSIIDSLD